MPAHSRPVPSDDPVPFATSSAAAATWPVLSADANRLLVSYVDMAGGTVGSSGRKFLAQRSSNGRARYHVGVDLYADVRDPVLACEDGRIVGFDPFLPSHDEVTYALLVQHRDFVVNYGEVRADSLSSLGLSIGSHVQSGQQIGRIGATEMLHFETYRNGVIHNRRWMVGESRPPELLNPTEYLLALAEAAGGGRAPSRDLREAEGRAPSLRVVDTLYEVYYSGGPRKRDIPLYERDGAKGLLHRGSMQIDVDGSPRAYFPGNANQLRLDDLSSSDGQGGSSTYVQGRTYGNIVARGPRPGFYVSATSLRYSQREMWDCDNFVDAEIIPYFVHPNGRNGVGLGDVGVIIDERSWKWTPAIHADTNDSRRVSEASLAVAVALGNSTIDPTTLKVTGLSAYNGNDNRNYIYLYFPDSAITAAATAPPWPLAQITTAATRLFDDWGGIEMVKACAKLI